MTQLSQMKENEAKVARVRAEVCAALNGLSKFFKPGYSLTFLGRNPNQPGQELLVSDDPRVEEIFRPEFLGSMPDASPQPGEDIAR